MSGTGPKAGGPFYLQRLSQLTNWQKPTVDTPASIDHAGLGKVQHLARKLLVSDAEQATFDAIVQQAINSSLNEAVAVLPGPTGEANTLSWRAPQSVAMYGGNLADSLVALAVLALNSVIAQVCPSHALADYAADLEGVLQVVEQPAADMNDVIVALSDMPADERLRFADLDGSIRRIINATSGLDMTRLYHEISQSYNTTAAGGNASLMASA
ncbi:Proline dehydrogenase Proline oxidase [Moraxella catarrhalis]|nr:Proline dehydrogenase Proline oxidase [Moraxella catarrhalis]